MPLSLKLPDETKTHYLLCQDKDAVENDDQVTFTDVTFLKKTKNDYQILKATMAMKDVIVKLTFEDETAIPCLEKESQIYVNHLKPLWGIHVPNFYDFYQCNPLDPYEPSCACMILQYCEEPAVSDLSRLKDMTSAAYLQQAIETTPTTKTEQQMGNDSVTEWRRIHSNWLKYHPDAVDSDEPPLGIVDLQEYLETTAEY